ncbi:MAG: M2 family metallopeptidase [Ignavibacteria bacterium]|nr:M2 family metallopeptidase [Ignavibacteria bacterium]
MKYFSIIMSSLLLAITGCSDSSNFQNEVQSYLDNYNKEFQKYGYEWNKGEWALNTHIVEGDTVTVKQAQEAQEQYAKFTGSKENIETATEYLKQKNKLTDLQVKQLNRVLYLAASNPQTVSELVKEKIVASTKQIELLFGYDFRLDGKSITPNEIDELLNNEKNLDKRLKVWEASKEVGIGLKDGLANLQRLRNETVQALGYPDFFSYQVSDYEMTVDEMREICQNMIRDIWPLYRELHTWARYTLAEKYRAKVPDMLPAQWLPNRWGQDWQGIIEAEGLNIDEQLKNYSAEWVVKKGEEFYVSLGFPNLPQSFWDLSSLYPAPPDAGYKKNNHASAWHMDNDKDVRSLMSVIPNTRWWSTSLHELGHIYYYISYSNPNVPIILREGANRGYHEAVGYLIGLASLQPPFLKQMELMPKDFEVNKTQALLSEALDYIPFIPWGAGVMTEFEHELYSNNINKDQFNKKWWELVKKYQGIVPPYERGEEYCDAATKTHINNDAAQYYDYAISFVLLFQFHDYISSKILKQDQYATNYYGSKEVGQWLKNLLSPGASVDWKEHLKSSIDSEMSAKALLEYFNPLMSWLKEQNKGRKYTLPKTF